MDSKTPAISPLSLSIFATEKTAWPLRATVLLVFSFASSSESDRAGKATALSYPVDPPRPYRSTYIQPNIAVQTVIQFLLLTNIHLTTKKKRNLSDRV